jgi:hypothetical protein
MTRNSAILCVAACLGAAAVPAYRLFEKHRSPVRRTIFVTVAGKTLPNLFSGLESDPQRFDWRHRARGAGSEGPAECAAKPTLVTRLLTSMHLSTVHASSCPPSVCNGTHAVPVTYPCSGSGAACIANTWQSTLTNVTSNLGDYATGQGGCPSALTILANTTRASFPHVLLAPRITRSPATSGNFALTVAAASNNAPWAPFLPITLHASRPATASPVTATAAAAPTASPARMLVVPGATCVPMGTA